MLAAALAVFGCRRAEPQPQPQPQLSAAASEPELPAGWTWNDGLGWRCAMPAKATFTDPAFAEPGVRGQVASVQLGQGGALAVTVGQRNGGSGVEKGHEREFFAGVRNGMQFSGRTSLLGTFEKRGLACVAEESSGTMGATPGDLLVLACDDRILVFTWQGATPTRLMDVVESCRFSPIGQP